MRGGIKDSAREFNVFSRNLEVGLVPTMGEWPSVIGMNRRLDIRGLGVGVPAEGPGTRYGPEDSCIGSVPRPGAAPWQLPDIWKLRVSR